MRSKELEREREVTDTPRRGGAVGTGWRIRVLLRVRARAVEVGGNRGRR